MVSDTDLPGSYRLPPHHCSTNPCTPRLEYSDPLPSSDTKTLYPHQSHNFVIQVHNSKSELTIQFLFPGRSFSSCFSLQCHKTLAHPLHPGVLASLPTHSPEPSLPRGSCLSSPPFPKLHFPPLPLIMVTVWCVQPRWKITALMAVRFEDSIRSWVPLYYELN